MGDVKAVTTRRLMCRDCRGKGVVWEGYAFVDGPEPFPCQSCRGQGYWLIRVESARVAKVATKRPEPDDS
jgi:hypothetical protein